MKHNYVLSLIDFPENSKCLSDKLKSKAIAYARVWKFLPFVRQVYLCNSVAIGNASVSSDIDLVIVTQKNRMFIARFIWMIYFWLLLQRPFWGFRPNQICPSLWLDADLSLVDSFALDYDPYLDLWKDTLFKLIDKPVKSSSSCLLYIINWFLGSLMLFKIHLKSHDHSSILANRRILKFHHIDKRFKFISCFLEDNR